MEKGRRGRVAHLDWDFSLWAGRSHQRLQRRGVPAPKEPEPRSTAGDHEMWEEGRFQKRLEGDSRD